MFCYSGAWTLDGSAGKDWAGVLSSQEKFQGLWPDGQKMRKNCWLFLRANFSYFTSFRIARVSTSVVYRHEKWLVDQLLGWSKITPESLQIIFFPIWGCPVPNCKSNYGQNDLLNFFCSRFPDLRVSSMFSLWFPRISLCFSHIFNVFPVISADFSHEFPRMSRFAPGDAQQQMALGRLPGPGARLRWAGEDVDAGQGPGHFPDLMWGLSL